MSGIAKWNLKPFEVELEAFEVFALAERGIFLGIGVATAAWPLLLGVATDAATAAWRGFTDWCGMRYGVACCAGLPCSWAS